MRGQCTTDTIAIRLNKLEDVTMNANEPPASSVSGSTVTGSVSASLPPITAGKCRVSSSTFISAARDFLRGFETLPEGAETFHSRGLLAAFCLEVTLKAYLLYAGYSEKRIIKLGHRLTGLWQEAVQEGLPLAPSPPQWCETLESCTSGPRFLLRYPRMSTCLVLPPPAQLINDLRLIVNATEKAISVAQ